MKTTTTDDLPGYEITEVICTVSGNVVQSKHIGRDIMAGLKSIIGGEVSGYSQMFSEAREQAHQRMEAAASNVGADAIVCMRYTSSAIAQGMSELLAYGTAVKTRKR